MNDQSVIDPEGLEAYFTDVESLRAHFMQSIVSDKLDKRILSIHGVGGVGKSSLLRMFRLYCKRANVPVGLASGDENKANVEVLIRWAEDLQSDKVKLSNFADTLKDYREIQAKVDEKIRKTTGSKLLDIAGKAASKTAETAGGIAAGTLVGSVIPGIGTAIGGALGGVIGGMGTEALVDWMRSFLSKPEIDLFLDPSKKLTEDLIEDINQAAKKQRLVIMLDTFEQLSALDDWMREFAKRVSPSVLLVIAGREMLNWDLGWPGWLSQTEIYPLEPMNEKIMRQLVNRYYATQVGGVPDPIQVEKIIGFARGLPMAVTTAVRLWVKYRVHDFGEVEAETIGELVRRLREGVPSEITPVLEAAAVVRYFNKPILRAVTGQENVDDAYNELRRFPFVKSSKEGSQPVLRLHDSVREFIDRSLQVDDPDKHYQLHKRAVIYFEEKLSKAGRDEIERLELEKLYHEIYAYEPQGLILFQQIASGLVHHRLINRLRALINDINTYQLSDENVRLWRTYYNGQLAYLEWRRTDAQQIYQEVCDNSAAEDKLISYALCDLGRIAANRENAVKAGGKEKAIKLISASLDKAPQLDAKLAQNFRSLSDVYAIYGDWDKAFENILTLRNYCQENGDEYGAAQSYLLEKTLKAIMGDWKGMLSVRKQGLEIIVRSYKNSSLYSELLWGWSPALAFAGRYAEAEEVTLEGLKIFRQLGEVDILGQLRDLGLIQALQGKFQDATASFLEYDKVERTLNIPELETTTALRWKGVAYIKQKKLGLALETLLHAKQLIENARYFYSFGECLSWLGLAYEVKGDLETAMSEYQNSLRYPGRKYFECGALAGIARIGAMQGELPRTVKAFDEAMELARKFEYNDHLASLHLTQGHTAWDGTIPEWGVGFDTTVNNFLLALIYALRHNRILLDEVLMGGKLGTPVKPIIDFCLDRGEKGLLIALRDRWQTGLNAAGMSSTDTISPIPTGIPLLDAERIARDREPGDGSPQMTVVERLEQAISQM